MAIWGMTPIRAGLCAWTCGVIGAAVELVAMPAAMRVAMAMVGSGNLREFAGMALAGSGNLRERRWRCRELTGSFGNWRWHCRGFTGMAVALAGNFGNRRWRCRGLAGV